MRVYDTTGISTTIASQSGGQGPKTGLYAMQWRRTEKGKQVGKENQKKGRVYGTDGVSPTLNTAQGGNRQPFIQNPKMLNYKKDYDNSVAITATGHKEPPVVNGIRRLTPTEAARLQGFPDHWHKIDGISDTQAYKCYGNAVTVNVVKAIIKNLCVPVSS